MFNRPAIPSNAARSSPSPMNSKADEWVPARQPCPRAEKDVDTLYGGELSQEGHAVASEGTRSCRPGEGQL